QVAVLPERGDEAAVPALALPAQDPKRGRHLGPGDRIRHERHPIRQLALSQVPMKPDDQVHVLGDVAGTIAADVDQILSAEEPECAGDDEVPTEAVPAEPTEQKRSQILDDLN